MFKFIDSSFKIALLATFSCFPSFSVSPQSDFHINKQLYSESADPSADIIQAQATAKRAHKHILLDFGGNWCGDCQVLDYNLHQPPNDDLLAKHYVVVHIDIGHIDKNLDVARRYGVQISHGVPGLAVLDGNGKVLYAQHEKEFEHATPEQLTALLDRYKSSTATRPGL